LPAVAHVLVTFGGATNPGTGDAEIWQCGVKLGQIVGGNAAALKLDDLAWYVNAVQGGLSTWFHAATSKMRQDYTLNFVKAANIGAGTVANPYGKYDGATDPAGHSNPAVYNYGSPVTGGASITVAPPAPPFVTLALTWRNSTMPRGPRYSASHGRIYPPFSIQSATSRLAGGIGTANSYVQAGTDLLTVLSKTGAPVAGGTTGVLKPCLVGVNGVIKVIDTVAVGDVLDTVRRRKDKLRENYASAAWS
jgi:hypothetical protein